ncbi:MAG: hypothetical protein LBT38_03405, partial [Deltaproteobacteria bacterium]|nr:hypothetical protein [Deltaproteobacteria bacterium]
MANRRIEEKKLTKAPFRGQATKKPDNYLSLEKGLTIKEPGGRLRVGLIWPGPYVTGMTSLGFLSVYSLLNKNPRVFGERFFQPEIESKALSLETKTLLRDFDLLAASLTLENDYWILLDILAKGQINPERVKRDNEPLVIAGGVGVWSNPWPIIPFVDMALLGEAEIQWPTILDLFLAKDFARGSKPEKLKILAERIPGALVPSQWPEEVWLGHAPLERPISPAVVSWPPSELIPPCSPIITPKTEFGARRLVEISRGCPHGCRFCLAGSLYRPHRPWPLAKILAALGEPSETREQVGLVSPAVADHPQIEELLDALKDRQQSVSVSSLRLSALTENLA